MSEQFQSGFELMDKEELREMQELNINYANRLNEGPLSKRATLDKVYTDVAAVLENPDQRRIFSQATYNLLSPRNKYEQSKSPKIDHILKKFEGKLRVLNADEIYGLTTDRRTNILENPLPPNAYSASPYIYDGFLDMQDKDDKNYLDNGDAIAINSRMIALAEISLMHEGKEVQFIFVRSENVSGWVYRPHTYQTNIGTLPDRLRPLDTFERLGDRFGIVQKAGLMINPRNPNMLVPYDPKLSNRSRIQQIFQSGGIPTDEDYGDGNLYEDEANGVSRVLAMADIVEVIGEEGDFVRLKAMQREFLVDAKYISKGYLTPTKENLDLVMDEQIDIPYSWGAKGSGLDCASFFQVIAFMNGEWTPDGSNQQKFPPREDLLLAKIEGDHTKTPFVNFLPANREDLKSRGINPDDFKTGITYASWGTHIMLFSHFDGNGNIIWQHSVGSSKVINNANRDHIITNNPDLLRWHRIYRNYIGPGTEVEKVLADGKDAELLITFSPLLEPGQMANAIYIGNRL